MDFIQDCTIFSLIDKISKLKYLSRMELFEQMYAKKTAFITDIKQLTELSVVGRKSFSYSRKVFLFSYPLLYVFCCLFHRVMNTEQVIYIQPP